MTHRFLEITEDEFDDRFPLVPNHLNPTAGWAVGEGGGCLFETFGAELAFVRQQDPRHVWTLIDGDDGDLYVVSGFCLVNRLGYLVSIDPAPADTTIQARVPMQADEEEVAGATGAEP